MRLYLKGFWHEIFDFRFGFFDKSVSSWPLSNFLGPLQIFLKFRGDIRNIVFIICVNDTGEKQLTVVTGFHRFHYTGDKFIASNNDTSDN